MKAQAVLLACAFLGRVLGQIFVAPFFFGSGTVSTKQAFEV